MRGDLIDVDKSLQLRNGFEKVHGGRMIQVQLDTGQKWLFLPDDLNKDFEDKFYHGYVAGDCINE